MRKSKKPAGNRRGAWLVTKSEFGGRYFGGTETDRLDLEEAVYGTAGRVKIHTEMLFPEVTEYERTLDEETDIAGTSFLWQGHRIQTLVFVSREEDILYYEMTGDSPCLNLTVDFLPEQKNVYLNYNLGGFYFEAQKRKALLIGKGELKTDGFPKADQDGIHIKNASKAAFRIYLKSEVPSKEEKPSVQAMKMQMAMNRYLAKLDSLSRESLLKAQEKKEE